MKQTAYIIMCVALIARTEIQTIPNGTAFKLFMQYEKKQIGDKCVQITYTFLFEPSRIYYCNEKIDDIN